MKDRYEVIADEEELRWFFKNALQKKYIFMLSLYFNTKSILIKIKKA